MHILAGRGSPLGVAQRVISRRVRVNRSSPVSPRTASVTPVIQLKAASARAMNVINSAHIAARWLQIIISRQYFVTVIIRLVRGLVARNVITSLRVLYNHDKSPISRSSNIKQPRGTIVFRAITASGHLPGTIRWTLIVAPSVIRGRGLPSCRQTPPLTRNKRCPNRDRGARFDGKIR